LYAAGAAGAIIINSEDTSFAIEDPLHASSTMNIPVVMVTASEGNKLLGTIILLLLLVHDLELF